MRVLFASSEAVPFAKTGGLGDVAGSLPRALKHAGAKAAVILPKYSTIPQEYQDRMKHVADFYVPLAWRNDYCGIEKLTLQGLDFYFVDNESYFKRDSLYGYFDDGERFAFFSKAITESLQHLPADFDCDILHCNDWQTALAPVFLREFYQGLPLYDRVKTVFSIHNVAFQGQFSDTVMEDILGVAHIPAAASQLRCDACSINYMLGALRYADAITTVSPTYASEIQTPEFGEGLDGVLRERSYALQGILNGIDVAGFDPATDKRIAANYTVEDRSGKAVCKAKLQEELGLEVRDDRPLMVMVTRLTRQKGMDLVMYALDRILAGGVQVAVLGTGKIGSTVIRHLSGFGCRMLAYDLYQNPEVAQLAEYADLETIWREADIITLHMPANPEDHHIINRESLSKMKDGVILINTARGDLIDTAALIEAIESRKVGAAALDVLEQESGLYYADLKTVPIPNHDLALLKAFPNVIVTPHTAFYTEEAVEHMVAGTVKGLLACEQGGENPYLVQG